MFYGIENNNVILGSRCGIRTELNSTKTYYSFLHRNLVEESGIKQTRKMFTFTLKSEIVNSILFKSSYRQAKKFMN